MFKRLLVAASVSALALLGLAPSASAAKTSDHVVVKVHKVKPAKAIDWDAPAADGGGYTVARSIDWD